MHMLAVVVLAQMPWTANLPSRGMSLDFLRPKFDAGGTSLTSGVAFLSGRFSVGSRSAMKLELPFAHLSGSGFSSSTLGNPYVGVELRADNGVSYEGGVRIPLTSETELASIMGLYGDVMQTETLLPDVLTIVGRVRYHRVDNSGFTFDVGGGPSVWAPTKGSGDPEVILHHSFSVGYRDPTAWVAAGIGGLLILTEDGSLGDRTIYEFGASAGLSRGQVRPAVHFILPLDDEVKNAVDLVIGLGVAVLLP